MIPTDRQQHLWRLMNQLRNEGASDLERLLRGLKEMGERLSINDVLFITSRQERYGSEFAVPASLARFLAVLLRSREAMSLLDPAGGLGLLGMAIASQIPLKRADVVCRHATAAVVFETLCPSKVTLHVGDYAATESDLDDDYDAIVSIPPMMLKRQRRTFATTSGDVSISGDTSELLLLDVRDRVKDDGVIACVMPPRFTWDDKKDSVRQNLSEFGLYLSALLRLRPGTFSLTNLAFDLAIIERVDRGDLFVAEVPDDDQAQDEMISRLRERNEGKRPSQGRLVPHANYRGLEVLEAFDRTEQLGQRKGMQAIPFEKAVRRISRPKRRGTEFTRCEEHEEAVYLPEMASTPATTSQTDLPEKLKSYLQLYVNPDVVLPEYLTYWFNTPLGHAFRQTTMRGTTIPRISQQALESSILYLPPLAEQRKALQALAVIRGLRSELAELESRVWDRPRKVDEVLEALQNVNHEERFADWLETLPFPIASVLRAYHAIDQTDKEKYDRLLHFFEALAAFSATIILSAFRSSEASWHEVKSRVVAALAKQNLSFARPTFGLWRVCHETLAAELRQLVNGNAEEQNQAMALFHVAELSTANALCSKRLVSVLQKTNNYRNRWSGHGGAVSHAEAASRRNLIEKELDEIRAVFGTTFLRFELIEMQKAEIMPGPLYRCDTRRVMGSNPAFEHRTIDLTTPANTGWLYLHNTGHDQALELLQFVQLKHAPQPACYFFNREETSGTHLVSYHFAEQAEVVDESHPFQSLISELTESEDGD